MLIYKNYLLMLGQWHNMEDKFEAFRHWELSLEKEVTEG